MNKRLAAAGLSASLLAGAAGFAIGVTGTAGAQSGSPTTTAPSTTKPSSDARLREALKPLLDNNTLTQAQIDAVVKALQDARPTGKGLGDGHRGSKGIGGGASLSSAATAIGVTEDEVRAALKAGQSLADFATSKGVDPQKVIDALLAPIVERANTAVTGGKLTQAQADQHIAEAKTRITDFVNGTAPAPKAGVPKARPHRAPRTTQSDSQSPGAS
jgi:hypothetical protein